jgi:hypothetical protein
MSASRSSAGTRLHVTAIVIVAVGVACLLSGLAGGRSALVLAALASSWLFAAGVAAGGVALGGAIRIAQGRWARSAIPAADACAAFFIPALVVLAVLEVSARAWMPSVKEMSNPAWAAMATRDLGASVILFALGRRLVSPSLPPESAPRFAVAYLLVYVVTLSVWIVDLVMGLKDWIPSTALPAYYFMGAFVSGLAWVALVACVKRSPGVDANERHDLGKLLFGLITFWAYLLWAIFLPTWYANMPEETQSLLLRWSGAYRSVTLGVLGMVFIVPFAVLLSEWAKRQRALLGIAAASVLAGLVAERFLLVLPTLALSLSGWDGVLGAGIALGVVASFALSFERRFTSTASPGTA